MVESQGIKLDCKDESKFLSCRWLYKCLKKESLKSFALRIEYGYWSIIRDDGHVTLLWNRTNICFFILCRNCAWSWGLIENGAKNIESSKDSSRKIRLLRPFGPDALSTTKDFKTDSISILVNTILSTWELTGRLGSMAFCSFRTVWLWKKVFNIYIWLLRERITFSECFLKIWEDYHYLLLRYGLWNHAGSAVSVNDVINVMCVCFDVNVTTFVLRTFGAYQANKMCVSSFLMCMW